ATGGFNTTTGTTPFDVTLGWEPKALKLWMVGLTATGDSTSTSTNLHASVGYVANSKQRAVGMAAIDGATTAYQNNSSSYAVVEISTTDGSLVGRMSIALTATGFTCTPSNAFAA